MVGGAQSAQHVLERLAFSAAQGQRWRRPWQADRWHGAQVAPARARIDKNQCVTVLGAYSSNEVLEKRIALQRPELENSDGVFTQGDIQC